MVVLGGIGTTLGPVVGAVLLLAMPQAITFLQLPPSIVAGRLQGIIFTLLVLLFMFLRPQGSYRLGRGRSFERRAVEIDKAVQSGSAALWSPMTSISP